MIARQQPGQIHNHKDIIRAERLQEGQRPAEDHIHRFQRDGRLQPRPHALNHRLLAHGRTALDGGDTGGDIHRRPLQHGHLVGQPHRHAYLDFRRSVGQVHRIGFHKPRHLGQDVGIAQQHHRRRVDAHRAQPVACGRLAGEVHAYGHLFAPRPLFHRHDHMHQTRLRVHTSDGLALGVLQRHLLVALHLALGVAQVYLGARHRHLCHLGFRPGHRHRQWLDHRRLPVIAKRGGAHQIHACRDFFADHPIQLHAQPRTLDADHAHPRVHHIHFDIHFMHPGIQPGQVNIDAEVARLQIVPRRLWGLQHHLYRFTAQVLHREQPLGQPAHRHRQPILIGALHNGVLLVDRNQPHDQPQQHRQAQCIDLFDPTPPADASAAACQSVQPQPRSCGSTPPIPFPLPTIMAGRSR